MRYRCIAVIIAILTTGCMAAPAPQTRPWRLAIAGGQAVAARGGDIPGYLSLLALHGLPRERLDDIELTDLERLRQFDIVIACWGNSGSEEGMRTLEQFAQDGGIVVCEGWPMPSSDVIPGKRLGPVPCPNVRFVPSSSPLSEGLPELGIIKCAAKYRKTGSIIPDPGSQAVVLARYTDEEAPKETTGQLRDGEQGAPAVILTPYGKGTILYYGPSMAPNLSPESQPPDHFICRFLRMVSDGELQGRLLPGTVDRAEFITQASEPDESTDYIVPPGPAQPAPKGFEVLDDAAQLQDFCLTGELPAEGGARVLVGYWSDREQTDIEFSAGKLTVSHVAAGQRQPPAVATLPQSAKAVLIARHSGLLSVTVDGALAYQGCPGPPAQGLLAVQGLQDPAYQPLAPVHFTDGFMRPEGEDTGQWEARGGEWRVVTSEGDTETGVNPFNYQITADSEATSLTGYWFWSDISCGVSAQGSGGALGLIANYAGDDHYLLLRLTFASDPRNSRVELVQHGADGDTVIAETTVTAARGDWHRLELRTSRGRLQGWLNGILVLAGEGAPAACGRVGLYCRQGAANFDDFAVDPWVASPPQELHLDQTVVESGVWERDNASGTLSGQGAGGAHLLLPWPAVSDCEAGVRVRPGQSEMAGLLLGWNDTRGTLVAVGRSAKGMQMRIYERGTPGKMLLETPVPGDPDEWHLLQARLAGPRLRVTVDGNVVGEVLDAADAGGVAGLYARGRQPARFRDFGAWAEPTDELLADEPTPEFAGVIDRNTWAGRSGAWTPDPARLDCLWHAGYFPGPVRITAGVHPQDAPETTTLLHLSKPGQPEAGYTLTAHRRWSGQAVELQLAYAGETVARGKASVAADAAYGLGLQRYGPDLLATVDGRTALTWRDAQARPELCVLGLDNGGQLLIADDTEVSSPDVHDYTFETAPTDWAVKSGTWKVSSRWSCSPGWSWFCGANADGPALAATRQSYVGDMDVTAYFSAKMIKLGGRMTEKLTDVHFGCCADEQRADSGYHFVVGADDNKRTVLLRNGQEVASNPYRIAQGLIHNDWLRLTIKRRGPEVALWVWDTPILSWNDPQPLPGGRVAIGTMRNGVVVPRVSIYGEQVQRAVSSARPATSEPGLPVLMFDRDDGQAEFGGDWGLWPQLEGCRGTATFMPGEDAEGKGGGAMKVDYIIKEAPHSFSLYANSVAGGVDLTPYDHFVIYAKGDVPSFTLVVKDGTADPEGNTDVGIADLLVTGVSDRWQRFELPFEDFVPRVAGAAIDWRTINHVAVAMMADRNAPSGTVQVDNLRAVPGE